ncbi:MAG TPA: aminotransferase class III-fold pyridoxal phosphate-dependent enzyme, partial [Actinomycetota bacterium]|nr:aminotransferase class III-fold pyridoxal phosphate-dependent enzyme [Actinomycetota bacterium]
ISDTASKEPASLATAAVMKRCHENGLLVLKCGTYDNVIRLLAPLVIADEELHRGLDILVEALEWANASAR